MTVTHDTTTTPIKDVRYNRLDGDWAYLLNGEIVGYAPTRLRAEQALNELVYQLLARDNVTAADLTPEEAEDVLAAQQLVAAEDAAQAELEQMERDVGVEETRRPLVLASLQDPLAVRREIDGTIFDANPDGLSISRRDRPFVSLSPLDAVALLTFIQSPNVARLISEYEQDIQSRQWLAFIDESERQPYPERWRPVEELPRGGQQLEVLTTAASLSMLADAERNGAQLALERLEAILRPYHQPKAA